MYNTIHEIIFRRSVSGDHLPEQFKIFIKFFKMKIIWLCTLFAILLQVSIPTLSYREYKFA